jgi:hypothetical protein
MCLQGVQDPMQTGINTLWAFGFPSHEDGSNIRPVPLTQFFIFFASSRPAIVAAS